MGNLVSDGIRTYQYDALDQLVGIEEGGTPVASFTYDSFGRRLSKTVNGTTTTYRYDGDNAIESTTGSQVSTILSGPGLDDWYASDDVDGRRYLLTDLIGSTVALTDASGAITTRYDYSPYGEVTSQTLSGAPSTNALQYTGRENDGTGLYYYRARYYSPELKRFTQEDPLGFVDGPNPYAYVGGNPISFVDPYGLAQVGDVAFFSWSGTTWPNHAVVITQVDANGDATHAFGAWGDTMTFYEADLRRYNGGVQSYIIGYGDMSGLNSGSLEEFLTNWNGRNVAPDWDGSQGQVCIDATTATDGWGGNTLRDAMRQDYQDHPNSYRDFGAGPANPSSNLFYRRNGWLQQFFRNTNRYHLP